jgi:hydroxyacylglutathione hydrolase
MFLHQFFVKGLGHASYLVGDPEGGIAAVIDPRRDVGAYLDLARDEGLRIAEIFETHVHNDYVSGVQELRTAAGAHVVGPARAGYRFAYEPMD